VGVTERLARACSAHPRRVFIAWAIALVAAIAVVALLLGELTTEGHPTNHPESQRGTEAIERAFPPNPRNVVTDVVVVRSERYRVTDPAFAAFVRDLFRRGRATDSIVSARTWYTTRDPSLVSGDRHATLIPLFVRDDDAVEPVIDVVRAADASSVFAVAITGEHTLNHDFDKLSQEDLKSGELGVGLPAALIVLLLVFGAVVAALVPLSMAIASIIGALGLVALLSQAFTLSVFIVNMLTGMGLALGIDYALFVISRYREERARSAAPDAAIATAGATASRAVLVSGTAFVVAMFGMLIVPNNVMRSLAAGAILVGIVSVLAALTLLPALLGVLHDRVDRLRLPFVGRRRGADAEGRFWSAVVAQVLRRPVVSLVAATALLLAAASPVLGLHVGTNGVSTLPDRLEAKRGYLALQRNFPSQNTDPVQVVVVPATPRARAALARLRDELARDPRFGPGRIARSRDTAVLSAPVRGDADGANAAAAVRDLRAHVLPRFFDGTGAQVYVTGTTAEDVDYYDSVTDPAPIVFAFVLGLTFVLLTVVFRSIVIAATTIVLNLLSVGAAYGLLVLVFQHGVGSGLLGFSHVETIEAWVPLFLFSVLFGLSMDYQVFLLSRIRERYDASGDTTDAVAHGVASTARIITGAALIIVAVFIGFASGDLVMFQQMGFGVAVALLLDATVIRSVLLPSAMTLLGRWNWYLPRWLEWLPRLEVERPRAQAPATTPAAH
jgi:RND superfamily putative drug exporter